MLFPTAAFAFVYLPLVLLAFLAIARVSHYAAAAWLFLASLGFYGYWMPEFTLLLIGSIVVNFLLGTFISRQVAGGAAADRHLARSALVLGIVFNLGLLAYFKYANFFIDNLNAALGSQLDIGRVILPIGISFYSFTQIAFLADAFGKGIREYRFAHYGLFVTYFPHLIAGPVLHHSQMMPQFASPQTYRADAANLAAGATIFALGLLKKVVLADGVSPYADPVFDAADAGGSPTVAEAWIGAMAYTFQIYFDFSGYSDMAIGLSLLFNIRLPLNFDSPYKSFSIVEFWRRWHISLSTFLRDYLYIPLGGNRKGPLRRHLNLMATMLLGGLWHGASWTFVLWGFLHGVYLVANHMFGTTLGGWTARLRSARAWRPLAWLLTFACVVVAWVFFRAHTFAGAARMLRAMAGWGADSEQALPLLWNAGVDPMRGVIACGVLALLAVFAPNSNRIGEVVLERCRALERHRLTMLGAAFVAVVFLVVVNESRDSVSPFIYFNF